MIKRRRVRISLAKYTGEDRPMTKTDALAALDRLRAEVRAGTFADPREAAAPEGQATGDCDPRLTIADVCDAYTKAVVEVPGRRESAQAADKAEIKRLRACLVPVAKGADVALDTIHAADLTAGMIEGLRTLRREAAAARAKQGEGRRYATQGEVATNRLLARLRRILNFAVDAGHLERSPFKRHDRVVVRLNLKAEVRRERRLGPGDEDRLLAAAKPDQDGRAPVDPHLRDLIIAALDTGCRKGELLGLQWADVENHEAPDQDGQPVARFFRLSATATKTGRFRRVPVSARLRAILAARRHAPDGKPHGPGAFVFGNAVGEQIKDVKTAFRATCRRAGIDDLHFHDLRREAASRMLEGGAPLHHVQTCLGHTNIEQTSTYLSALALDLERTRQALDLLENSRKVPANGRPAAETESASSPQVSVN